MGKLFWMIAAGAAGYYGFRRLQRLERDIRHEVGREGEVQGSGAVDPEDSRPKTARKPKVAPPSLEEQITRRVTENPAILQTELYTVFPEENRRTLQEMLRKMEREGGLKRTKEGGTYRLFPA